MNPTAVMESSSVSFTSTPRRARIEIIPLIDVVFFLLATFVLFTLSLDRLGGFEVPLPAGGQPNPDDTTVFIQASDAGTYLWKVGREGAPELIRRAEIRPRLADYKEVNPAARVLVQGDFKATFGSAIAILEEARLAGIREASIETLPPH